MRRALKVLLCLALAGLSVGVGYWLGARSDPAVEAVAHTDVRRCTDWTRDAPTATELYGGCGEPGDVLVGFAVTDCVTGPDLFAGSLGWGYLGETMNTNPLTELTRATCEGWADSL